MKKLTAVNATFAALITGSVLTTTAYAGEPTDATRVDSHDTAAQLERQTSDAWREGKLDTIYLFNRHLNNFTIDPEVRGNTVRADGKSGVKRRQGTRRAAGTWHGWNIRGYQSACGCAF